MKECTEPKKELPKNLQKKINTLLNLLNQPDTTCTFWQANDPHFHLMGVRPVNRTTIEIINQNGFNPYEKKVHEKLFKLFKIFINHTVEQWIITEKDAIIKNKIEKDGTIYIKSDNLDFIIETIRKCS